jgi:hypothetical protein
MVSSVKRESIVQHQGQGLAVAILGSGSAKLRSRFANTRIRWPEVRPDFGEIGTASYGQDIVLQMKTGVPRNACN